MKETYSQQDLIDFQPQHGLFIGLDSDGCVFDSMTVKQRIFHTEIINIWALHERAAEVRKLAEWVSLYSPWRGLNRFQLILKIFQTVEEQLPGVGKKLPIDELSAFIASGVPFSMTELEKRNDAGLQDVYDWSAEVSRQIKVIGEMPVFDEVVVGLEVLQDASDIIVVSQTTEEALVREWRNAELEEYIGVIAGAELGTKAESLTRAAVGRYPLDRIVMIGDAPGDLEAARAVGCLFFPIIPGEELSCWIELRTEALRHANAGTFSGEYQEELIRRFDAALSSVPPKVG